jgi:hypothetical protein
MTALPLTSTALTPAALISAALTSTTPTSTTLTATSQCEIAASPRLPTAGLTVAASATRPGQLEAAGAPQRRSSPRLPTGRPVVSGDRAAPRWPEHLRPLSPQTNVWPAGPRPGRTLSPRRNVRSAGRRSPARSRKSRRRVRPGLTFARPVARRYKQAALLLLLLPPRLLRGPPRQRELRPSPAALFRLRQLSPCRPLPQR